MGDRDRLEEYRKKFLEYWHRFLALCGILWERAADGGKEAWAFVKRHGKALARKLAALAVRVREWVRKAWAFVRHWAKRIWGFLKEKGAKLLGLASLGLLAVRERISPLWAKVRAWFTQAAGKVRTALPERKPKPLPAPEKPAPAPAVQPAVSQKPAVKEPQKVTFGGVLRSIGKWIRRLYKFVMAAPVVWAAVKLAVENMDRLPESVGLDFQSTGEFAVMISRSEAVWWPLGLTAFCLGLMFIARKPLLPWIISIFSLVLPILIWLTNSFA